MPLRYITASVNDSAGLTGSLLCWFCWKCVGSGHRQHFVFEHATIRSCDKRIQVFGVLMDTTTNLSSGLPRLTVKQGRTSCVSLGNEPLFGPQNSARLTVSVSLGHSVEFQVRRHASDDVPSPIRLDHGDLLVMDGLAQSEYVHRTVSGQQGPRVYLAFRWITQHITRRHVLRSTFVCARFSRARSTCWGDGRNVIGLFLFVGPPVVSLGVPPSGARTFGSGQILSLHLPSLSFKTRKLRLLASWLSTTLLMLSFVRRGCRISVGLATQCSRFLRFVDPFLSQEPILDLPRVTGQDLSDVAKAKKSTVGGLGWAWNEIESLLPAWFSGLAILLNMVETTAVWPQGLLDAFFAMIPKVDDVFWVSVLCVLWVIYWMWASLRLTHLRGWVEGWVLESVFSLGNGVSSVEAWFSTALDIEKVLSGASDERLHVMVADVITSFDTVGRSILDCALGRLGLSSWFRKACLAYHSQVRLRFKLAAGLGEPWCQDGGHSSGMPTAYVFCCLVCPR